MGAIDIAAANPNVIVRTSQFILFIFGFIIFVFVIYNLLRAYRESNPDLIIRSDLSYSLDDTPIVTPHGTAPCSSL